MEEEEKEEERGGGGGGGSKRGCYEFSRGFGVLDDKTTSACFRSRIATEPNEEIHFRDDYYNYYDYYYDYYYDDDDDDDVTKGNGTKKIRGVSRASVRLIPQMRTLPSLSSFVSNIANLRRSERIPRRIEMILLIGYFFLPST